MSQNPDGSVYSENTVAIFQFNAEADCTPSGYARLMHLYLLSEVDDFERMMNWYDTNFDELTELFITLFDDIVIADEPMDIISQKAEKAAAKFAQHVQDKSGYETRFLLPEPWSLDGGIDEDTELICADVDGMVALSLMHEATDGDEDVAEYFLFCAPVANRMQEDEIYGAMQDIQDDLQQAMEDITHIDEASNADEITEEQDTELFRESQQDIEDAIQDALGDMKYLCMYPCYVWGYRKYAQEKESRDDTTQQPSESA